MKKIEIRVAFNSSFFAVLACCFGLASCQVKNKPAAVVEKIEPEKHKIAKVEIKASQEFVQGSEDIPLPEKMTKIFEENLGFDSESGSVMSSSYSTEIAVEDVREFYRKNLTQMGWKVSKNSAEKISFKRENESLEIEFSKLKNRKNQIRFFLSTSL